MKEKTTTDNLIFLSLEHLLKLEWTNTALNLSAGKQKSNSVLSGRYASKLRGRGLDFEEARLYVIGDDIRNIDWRVTARTGKTHTKVFTEEKEKPAFIFVDQSATMGFGSTHKTKSVVAGELAAIAAYKILKRGDRIGGMVYKGADYDLIDPKRSRQHVLEFLEKIVKANHEIYEQPAFSFSESLRDVINKVQNIVTHDYLTIIISDFCRYDPDALKYYSLLAEHNDVILIKIYDPMEERLPKEKIALSNRVKQIQVGADNKKLQRELEEDFDSNYKNFKSEVEKYGITIFKINTVDPLEEQLIEFFSKYQGK
ncbi:DUF58 domain-containing protein [Flavobacteriaceae bacterium F89]|uniref:DUF58 domain-containing protein n=1 Tax=Cerina litoralis TaxID=2874477 RepID=A0AAE3EWC0_9FLAO|nr:DUF58 domain-containing protein [Cerina litoralis]MCG2461710.1 DUF58 domain-containing protein [Cerina litoralis]